MCAVRPSVRLLLTCALLAGGCTTDGRTARREAHLVAPFRVVTAPRGSAEDGHAIGRLLIGERDAGPAIEARTFGGGIAILRPDGALVLRRDGAEVPIDRAVRPGLAIDGDRIAWVTETESEATLHRAGLPALASTAVATLAQIDRVLFLDGERLLFVGSEAGGLPGLYLSDRTGTRRVTNHGMRAGGGLPPDFVSPPVAAESVRPVAGGIIYCDGEAGWRVEVESGRARRDPSGCSR
jgi:hypothetical protein